MKASLSMLFLFLGLNLFAQLDTGQIDTIICRNNTMQYLLKPPAQIDQSNPQPLLIFLHGAGERGGDLSIVNVHGPLMEENLPFVSDVYVLTPQCPKGIYWDTELLYLLIKKIIASHDIDESRVYLTGLSMGGWGTWRLSIEHPELFAAIAPVCPPVDEFMFANIKKIKDIPVWAFHGKKDSVVPVEFTINMIEALQKLGANPRVTIYPKAGHNAWSDTYSNSEFYSWLFSKKKQ